MVNFFYSLFGAVSPQTVELALAFLRIGIGLLTIPHGFPKLMGGVAGWHNIGTTFMQPLGINFWPIMWGFLGAVIEFFGGIALVLGLGTRISSFALVIMMIIAAIWHIQRGDTFNLYSFPLSLIVVFAAFMVIGGGYYSLDSYILKTYSSTNRQSM